MSAHASQAFSIVHCTNSEDLPRILLEASHHQAFWGTASTFRYIRHSRPYRRLQKVTGTQQMVNPLQDEDIAFISENLVSLAAKKNTKTTPSQRIYMYRKVMFVLAEY